MIFELVRLDDHAAQSSSGQVRVCDVISPRQRLAVGLQRMADAMKAAGAQPRTAAENTGSSGCVWCCPLRFRTSKLPGMTHFAFLSRVLASAHSRQCPGPSSSHPRCPCDQAILCTTKYGQMRNGSSRNGSSGRTAKPAQQPTPTMFRTAAGRRTPLMCYCGHVINDWRTGWTFQCCSAGVGLLA